MRNIGVTGVQTCALPIYERPVAGHRVAQRDDDLLLAGRAGEVALARGLARPRVGEGVDAAQMMRRPVDREAAEIGRAPRRGRVQISAVADQLEKKTHTVR